MLDPKRIVEQEFAKASPEALALVPDRKNIYRAIRLIKRNNGIDIDEPKSLAEINVGKLEKLETIDGEKLFFADTGVVEGGRSLIFTTPFLLDIVTHAKGIACDVCVSVSV